MDKKTDCLVLAVWEKTGPADCALLDESLAALAGAVFKAGDIKGKTGETLLIPVHTHAKTERLLLVGAGDASKFDAKAYRKVIRATAQAINKTSAKSAIFTLPQLTV
ncbi:MAG: M17 family peptidase N-terminal domain-containing protein, partial [Pseudohongiella sp.]|nr:M17 family peptidase N-terminal domain-containing protein [Pseudohongiella sp.]